MRACLPVLLVACGDGSTLRTGDASPIDATGTTLDGQGFTGQTFRGPVTNAPFLRITDAGELRF